MENSTPMKSRNELTSNLNEDFRRMLESSGWNQSEAARALHVSSNHVNQIVHDRGVPSPLLMAYFQRILTPVERGNELAKALASLSPEDRDQAARTIQAIVDSFKTKAQKTTK